MVDFQNFYSAARQASKAKHYQPEVLAFNWQLEENILSLQKDIFSGLYQPGQYRRFIVYDSKKREIVAPDFRDRVFHHALHNIIEPIFDRGFISDSYACRQNKGNHRAIKRLQNFLRTMLTERERERGQRACAGGGEIFVLKCDISHYFQNIDHDILFNLIKKKIRDQKILNLIKIIIDSHSPGLPIGNLTSQLFANIYLNELDKFIKHTLCLKYYLRYMDDFLILGYNKGHKPCVSSSLRGSGKTDFSTSLFARQNKKDLWLIKDQIQDFLRQQLKLEFNPKQLGVSPASRGIDFLGYVVFPNYCLLRQSTIRRYIKKIKAKIKKSGPSFLSSPEFKRSWASWRGYAKFAESWHLRKKIVKLFKDQAALAKGRAT